MASNRSALDEAPYGSSGTTTLTGTDLPTAAPGDLPAAFPGFPGELPGDVPAGSSPAGAVTPREPAGPAAQGEGPAWAWNPTEETAADEEYASLRGRHRVARQRGGTVARGGAVLGVGVMAAVGASGMATAKDRPAAPVSVPDLAHLTHEVGEAVPDADSLPGVGSFLTGGSSDSAATTSGAPLTSAGVTSEDAAKGVTTAGEALRARILQQAESQQTAADDAKREAASKAAADQAAHEAAHQKAEQEAERKAAREKERRKQLAADYTLPVASYTLTAGFGESGDLWSANHTGQDFAAPTGTPVKAVHGGTVTQAGWAGSYGYRIVLRLDDGTELWFCHLSSMVKTSGRVATGEVIGRVGATGNVTGPHLHLEVRPGGGQPIDPMPWLRDHGLNP